TVDQPHRERPANDQAYLKSGDEMAALFRDVPGGAQALASTSEIGAQCEVALLKGFCVAPAVPVPAGETPTSYLRALCERGLRERYTDISSSSPQRRQLEHELEVIAKLELEEFFLCVHDIVDTARSLRLRVSGRGSAANSIVAYLLGITNVCPIQ